jgi:DNA-binding LacI/PurR family transcriptional regulator
VLAPLTLLTYPPHSANPLTTIRQPLQQMGEVAVKMALDLIGQTPKTDGETADLDASGHAGRS